MRSGLRALRNAAATGTGSKPPVPLVQTYRRGLVFDLGAGKASRETFMRTYGQSGTVFSIVSLLAEAAATPAWHLYKKQPKDGRVRYSTGDVGDDQRTEVVQHAALTLWNQPNTFMSGFEFREGSNQHEELTGETVWVVSREATTFPTALWYVRPDRMEPVPSPDDYLVGWIYTGPSGEQVPLQLDEVIIEKRPDPMDPFRGMGPVQAILSNIEQQKYATDYQRNLFINGADPGGVITVDKRLDESEFDEMVDRWRETHQGVARAGRVGVLESGAQFTNAGLTNKDLEYGNLRATNRDELREAWRMHKSMLGTVEDVNRANAQTAEEVFVAWSEIPRLNRRRETLNTKLLPMFGSTGEGVEFDYDDPSPVNQEAANAELLIKSQAAAALINAGFDPSDVLEVVGLPDMDVVEKATQVPALPPGWVPGTPPGAPAGDDQDQLQPEVVNLVRRAVGRLMPQAAAPKGKQWPGWDLDLQAVAHWAPQLSAAVSGELSKTRAAQIAAAYLAVHPDGAPDGQGKREAAQAAASWLGTQGLTLTPAVAGVLPGVIADGYLIGAASAAAMTDGATSADTGDWQPGDTQAAQQHVEDLGVSGSLGSATATADQGSAQVAAGYTLALGSVLAEGAATGATAAVMGAGLAAALSDAGHASVAVLNHLSTAAGVAARALYAHRGVAMGNWLNDGGNVCPVCLGNSEASPLPIGSAYPSGDTETPAHDRCRCALIPDGGMANRLRRVLSDGYVPVEIGRR